MLGAAAMATAEVTNSPYAARDAALAVRKTMPHTPFGLEVTRTRCTVAFTRPWYTRFWPLLLTLLLLLTLEDIVESVRTLDLAPVRDNRLLSLVRVTLDIVWPFPK